MKPEDLARERIDAQLAECGWIVQDGKAMNIMAGPGVAVREFILKPGHGRAGTIAAILGRFDDCSATCKDWGAGTVRCR